MLRVFQLKALDQLLGTRPSRTLRQNRNLGVEIVPRLEVRFRLPFLIHSLIVRPYPNHPIAIEQ
jgi:antitoxin component HigA of HigAB toxin-antitoxin module